jgi:hypothetical protein
MAPQLLNWESQIIGTRAMAQQSGGEFASANPTKGEENAGFQERGIRAKISLNACRRLQHV